MEKRYKLIVCGIKGSTLSRSLFKLCLELPNKGNYVEVFFVNVEEEKEYVYEYNINVIPSLLVFENNEFVKKMTLPIKAEDII
jgi:thiol-disulfide isomerase/thioredoxin